MELTVKKSIFDCWHCIVTCGLNNDPEQVANIISWCSKNFSRGQWGLEHLHNRTSFILYSEQDAMLFALRWS